VANSIHPSAVVGKAAVLGDDNVIDAHVVIEDGACIGSGNHLWPGSFVARNTTLGNENQVHMGAVLGHLPQDVSFDDQETFTRIGDRNQIREYVTIHRATTTGEATVIGSDCFLMVNSHVAHDCRLGDQVTLVNNALLAGHCDLDDGVILSGHTAAHQFCRIGKLTLLSGLSAINLDAPPFMIVGGRPGEVQGLNLVGLRRNGYGRDERMALKGAFKVLYRSDLSAAEALARLDADFESPAVGELANFIRSSKRGILGHGEGKFATSRRSAREVRPDTESGD
jgi:UDP-N-acetylglucosamine acyltransferase